MSDFIANSRFDTGSVVIGNLKLCQLRLQNDARFPWLVLIPRREGLSDLTDIAFEDEADLWADLRAADAMVRSLATSLGFALTKVNIANLGNIVPQLHLHVIARHTGDAVWPGPVWGVGEAIPYAPDALQDIIEIMHHRL